MPMNLIQEGNDQVKFYSSMLDVEAWLGIDLSDFDWHISDIDGGWSGLSDPAWVTGRELKTKLAEHDYQFIWAVFSAFPSGAPTILSDKPYADGNPDFWNGIPSKQLENAVFEIVCWDSSATLFIGLSDEFAQSVLAKAPGITDLNKYNKSRSS